MKKQKSAPILIADELHDESTLKTSHLRSLIGTIAEQADSEVHLLYAEDLSLLPAQKSLYKTWIDEFLRKKKNTLKEIEALFKVKTKSFFVEGYPTDAILSQAKKKPHPWFLAMTTHGRKGLKRALLGSVTEEVLRQTKTPTLVLGPNYLPAASNSKKLIIATDLGPNSIRAEEFAIDFAKRFGLNVIFLHSLREGFHPIMTTALGTHDGEHALSAWFDQAVSNASKKLEAKAKKLTQKKMKASFVLDKDSLTAQEALLKLAKQENAEFVAMGTHSRTAVGKLFFGSTARETILASSCAVFIVNSKS